MSNKREQRTNRSVWLLILLITAATAVVSIPLSAQSRRPGTGITLFTNPNFGGEATSFRSDTADLRPYSLNDKISSIELANGEVWEICQDINYGNRCQVISNSVPNLKSIGWNDRISSLRRVSNNRGRNSNNNGGFNAPGFASSLVFFDRPGYRGSSMTLTNENTNLGAMGARGGSVQVRAGTWELCDRTGRCATVSQNVSDLSQLGLNGRITSARPVSNNNRGYGRDRSYRR